MHKTLFLIQQLWYVADVCLDSMSIKVCCHIYNFEFINENTKWPYLEFPEYLPNPVRYFIKTFQDFLYSLTTRKQNMSRRMTKPNQRPVRPVKTQISLGIRPVWSESSLSAWRNTRPLTTYWAHRKTLRCPGWSESALGAHVICWFCHAAAHKVSDNRVTSFALLTICAYAFEGSPNAPCLAWFSCMFAGICKCTSFCASSLYWFCTKNYIYIDSEVLIFII